MADVPFYSPFQLWSSPSSATIPTWVTPVSQTAASSAYNSIWVSPTQTASGLAGVLGGNQWVDATNLYVGLTRPQRAYERYELGLGLYRPSGLWQESIARPAIITHQEQARRDEALYRRALAECNEQEAARVLRLIEQREQTVAAQRAALQAQQQRQREDQQQRDAAQLRARELLLEHLTPDQRDTFVKKGWFIVQGGRTKTAYRIRGDTLIANVDVIGGRHRLCAHARSGSVPMGDQLLAQKIMLELAEDDFLRIANRHAA